MNTLILQLMALQVGLPLLLIALNMLLPAASALALMLRATAVLLVIAYMALAGMWLFPPWWTPYLLALLHLGGTACAWSRLSRKKAAVPVWQRWGEPGLAIIALIGVAAMLVPVMQGRATPEETVDLAMPLGPGSYYVVSGGGTQAINVHLATLTGAQFAPWRGQSFAVDIIGIDGLGLHATGIAPREPSAYVIHGAEVRAPCGGEVLFARDDLPDLPVPEVDRDNLAGNHVLIACGDHVVALAHLMPGSVAVAAGEQVAVGAIVGRVGNSGNTSEPHLHVHVQRAGTAEAPLSGEPMWFTVAGRFLVRGDVIQGAEQSAAQ